MAYFGKGDLITAINCLKKSIYLDPFNGQVIYNLGTLFFCILIRFGFLLQ